MILKLVVTVLLTRESAGFFEALGFLKGVDGHVRAMAIVSRVRQDLHVHLPLAFDLGGNVLL